MNPEDKTIKVPPPVHELVQRLAAAEQRTLRGVVQRALTEYARRHTPAALKKEVA